MRQQRHTALVVGAVLAVAALAPAANAGASDDPATQLGPATVTVHADDCGAVTSPDEFGRDVECVAD